MDALERLQAECHAAGCLQKIREEERRDEQRAQQHLEIFVLGAIDQVRAASRVRRGAARFENARIRARIGCEDRMR